MEDHPVKTVNNLFPSTLFLNLYSNDAEQMEKQSAFWPYEHKQFSSGRFHGKILAAHTQHMQLSLSSRSTGISIHGNIPVKTTIFGFPLSPHYLLHYRGKPMQNYQAITLRHGQEIELLTAAPSTFLTVAICNKFLEQQSLAITGKSFDRLKDQDRLLFRQNDYARLTKNLFALLEKIQCSTGLLERTEEMHIEKSVLEILLTCIKTHNATVKMPTRHTLAKKTETLIRKHFKNPISVTELSRSIGTSERSLYLGFKERFGVSPKAYMQIMRLNGVQRELLSDNSRSVSETAMAWGFFHLGRFSQQYSRMFGELPSKTRFRHLQNPQ